jgi:hypothetical protein
MDVVEETGGLIRERIITSYELSDYALVKCEIDCLFFIPQQMWVVEAVVIESCALCSQNMKFMFISLHKEVMTQGISYEHSKLWKNQMQWSSMDGNQTKFN